MNTRLQIEILLIISDSRVPKVKENKVENLRGFFNFLGGSTLIQILKNLVSSIPNVVLVSCIEIFKMVQGWPFGSIFSTVATTIHAYPAATRTTPATLGKMTPSFVGPKSTKHLVKQEIQELINWFCIKIVNSIDFEIKSKLTRRLYRTRSLRGANRVRVPLTICIALEPLFDLATPA